MWTFFLNIFLHICMYYFYFEQCMCTQHRFSFVSGGILAALFVPVHDR